MGAPLAYFITWTCHGTWLHGDARLSVDRAHNSPGRPLIAPDRRLETRGRMSMTSPERRFTIEDRAIVDSSIRQTCGWRGWTAHALNVRSNHVHLVVSGNARPERMMQGAKSWATRALRQAGRVGSDDPVWTRHGSTIYLWTFDQMSQKVDYVMNRQDDPDRFTSEPRA